MIRIFCILGFTFILFHNYSQEIVDYSWTCISNKNPYLNKLNERIKNVQYNKDSSQIQLNITLIEKCSFEPKPEITKDSNGLTIFKLVDTSKEETTCFCENNVVLIIENYLNEFKIIIHNKELEDNVYRYHLESSTPKYVSDNIWLDSYNINQNVVIETYYKLNDNNEKILVKELFYNEFTHELIKTIEY